MVHLLEGQLWFVSPSSSALKHLMRPRDESVCPQLRESDQSISWSSLERLKAASNELLVCFSSLAGMFSCLIIRIPHVSQQSVLKHLRGGVVALVSLTWTLVSWLLFWNRCSRLSVRQRLQRIKSTPVRTTADSSYWHIVGKRCQQRCHSAS